MIEHIIKTRGWFEEVKVENTFNQHGTDTQNMLKCTPHAGKKPYNSLFDWGNYFPHVAQAMRNKKYKYPTVSNLVLNDINLSRAINQAADETIKDLKSECDRKNQNEEFDSEKEQLLYQSNVKKQEKRGYSILMNMRSTINHYLLAFTSWVLYKLLPCFLSGVITHTKQIEMLKTASEKAPGIPLIFLPLHRSHLDYIMVTFILTNNNIKSPLVAAGNNLQIPVFGGLLRGLGAFFIKRKIDPVTGKKDILYRAILELYMQHALKKGHNIEFFIEGGRTRTGKPCLPKNGILSVIVNAFMEGTIPDALLVPVSVNYERLVDGNFVNEQIGIKKNPETFKKAVSAIWKALNSKYGLMRIDFNEPYSIKELVSTYNKIAKSNGDYTRIHKPSTRQLQHNQSTSSLYGTDVVCEEHRTLINSISRQIVYDCSVATSVMTTNALAHLLLTSFRNGGYEKDISDALDKLRETLQGQRDIGFSGESRDVIRYAVDLLGESLITCTKNENGYFIQPILSIESLIELSYYANSLTPHFVLHSVIVTALHSLLNGKPKGSGISTRLLLDTCIENCDVLRYEFILNKPTQTLEMMLDQTLDELTMRNIITVNNIEEDESVKQSRKLVKYLENELTDFMDSDDGTDYRIPEIFLSDQTITEQESIMAILAPFAHTYFNVASSLKLLFNTSILETEFVKIVICEITKKVNKGSCPYGESVSTESVKNCLKLFEKWSVINIYSQHGLRLLSLGSLYDSSLDSLNNIIHRIESIVPLELKK
ncbi:GPAM family protein [Megaselia abdita]